MAVGDLPQATRRSNVLLQATPESAAVQTAAGMLATMKQDTAGARAARTPRALDADPRSYQALAGLLTAEMHGKKFGAAKALIEKQLALEAQRSQRAADGGADLQRARRRVRDGDRR